MRDLARLKRLDKVISLNAALLMKTALCRHHLLTGVIVGAADRALEQGRCTSVAPLIIRRVKADWPDPLSSTFFIERLCSNRVNCSRIKYFLLLMPINVEISFQRYCVWGSRGQRPLEWCAESQQEPSALCFKPDSLPGFVGEADSAPIPVEYGALLPYNIVMLN